jgi:hypothetical protein
LGFPDDPEADPKRLAVGQERYVNLKDFFDKKIKNGKIIEPVIFFSLNILKFV